MRQAVPSKLWPCMPYVAFRFEALTQKMIFVLSCTQRTSCSFGHRNGNLVLYLSA